MRIQVPWDFFFSSGQRRQVSIVDFITQFCPLRCLVLQQVPCEPYFHLDKDDKFQLLILLPSSVPLRVWCFNRSPESLIFIKTKTTSFNCWFYYLDLSRWVSGAEPGPLGALAQLQHCQAIQHLYTYITFFLHKELGTHYPVLRIRPLGFTSFVGSKTLNLDLGHEFSVQFGSRSRVTYIINFKKK